MDEFVLKGLPRAEFGKKASRQLRRDGRLPVNIYGHKQDNLNATLDAREFRRFFEAGHRIATLDIDGAQEYGVIKEVQYDGLGSEILHVDFSRVSKHEKIEIEVPFEVFGVVLAGVMDFPHKEVKVRGVPASLPEHIELRVGEMKIGDTIRVKDIPVPEGCSILDDPELVILAVHAPKGVEEAEEESTEGASSEPEVIGKPNDEEGEAAGS
jgi:large subunit ribosomal protein L25